jgi:hypothetical protein
MEEPKTELQQLFDLAAMLKSKRGKKFYAEKLGVSLTELKVLYAKVKSMKIEAKVIYNKESRKEDLVKGLIESVKTVKFKPSSHKELSIIHKVDLNKFIITNYWSKIQPNGDFLSSIFCRRKESKDYTIEDFSVFLKKYKSTYTPIKSLVIKDKNKELVDLELSISDYHLAKRYANEKNSNIDERAEVFFNMAFELMKKTINIYNVDTVVFPISNDFFHTDTYYNTSTKGTPQDTIVDYDEEYEVGFDVLVKTITFLLTVSNKVIIVLVPGNHDKTKSFYLAHALDVYFKKEKNISFLRESTPTKYVTLGKTFIGYHHGNCKIDELPLLFATGIGSSCEFGSASYREVHVGHRHYYMAKEIKGVRIQQMPSLSGDDKWHRDNNFVNNVRAALVLIYDKIKGKSGEFEERI